MPVLGEIVGWEFLLVLLVTHLVFGWLEDSAAHRDRWDPRTSEFEKGINEDPAPEATDPKSRRGGADLTVPVLPGAFSPAHLAVTAMVRGCWYWVPTTPRPSAAKQPNCTTNCREDPRDTRRQRAGLRRRCRSPKTGK